VTTAGAHVGAHRLAAQSAEDPLTRHSNPLARQNVEPKDRMTYAALPVPELHAILLASTGPSPVPTPDRDEGSRVAGWRRNVCARALALRASHEAQRENADRIAWRTLADVLLDSSL
jgi:hypothetical protein